MAGFVGSFGMLDIVLAVFFACIFALRSGHGKKLSGLLSGALLGWLVKPLFIIALGVATLTAVQQPEPRQEFSPKHKEKIDKFWGKFLSKPPK